MAPDAVENDPSSAWTRRATSLQPFALEQWLRRRHGSPTPAQRLAAPHILRGKNTLIAAPTGSGKTLAAFLPILSRLADSPANGIACLCVTPLKALTRDLAKNLRRNVRQLHFAFPDCPLKVRIGMRNGDSSAKSRRQMLDRPPQILVTTPESMSILLTQAAWCTPLGDLRWIVVDEVHALAANKRGADLALGLERLEALISGRHPGRALQRIGLSATCAPLDVASRFLAGTDRPCAIVSVAESASMELIVEPLFEERESLDQPAGFIARLVERLTPELMRNRSTLIFANIRSLAERLTWALRRRFPHCEGQIAVHHSSLAAERRRQVERRLKRGKLRVVVTSTSLELGMDIGSVDGVVFVHPPGGVVQTLQRIGRSGHGPGRLRRGLFLTAGPSELLEATVTAASSHAGQLERLRIVEKPLDILCQHLAGMAMTGWNNPNETLMLVRRAYSYRDLSEDDFSHCLNYLSGRLPDGREWLPSRLRWQDGLFSIASQTTARLLRRNLGSIVSEATRPVHVLSPASLCDVEQGPRTVGSLEESFADQLRAGDRFMLDGQSWQFRRIEDFAVLVDQVAARPTVPRWTTGGLQMAPELASRLYAMRVQAGEALRESLSALETMLRRDYHLGPAGIRELLRFFTLQEAASEIPGPDCLLIETVENEVGVDCFFHTPLARSANDALGRVLAWRLRREHGVDATALAADLGFLLALPTQNAVSADDWWRALDPQHFERDLREAVSDCPSLRDRFARVAATGLMVLRNPWGGRRKVGGREWAQRRLFDQVRRIDAGFLLLRQAEREMFEEVCAVRTALAYVGMLPRMHVRCRWLPQPSPFAAAWTLPADAAHEVLDSPDEALAKLHRELLKPGREHANL